MEFYRCGKILTTHGVKGDLKVMSISDFDRFQKGNRLYVKYQGNMEEVIINKVSPFGKYLFGCVHLGFSMRALPLQRWIL